MFLVAMSVACSASTPAPPGDAGIVVDAAPDAGRCGVWDEMRCDCGGLGVGRRQCDLDAAVYGACVCPPPPACDPYRDCHMCGQQSGCGFCPVTNQCERVDLASGVFLSDACRGTPPTGCAPPISGCAGRMCGTDARGNPCGSCPDDSVCDDAGRCVR